MRFAVPVVAAMLATPAIHGAVATGPGAGAPPPAVVTVPGMPGVPDPSNLYSETGAGKVSAAVAADLPRVYVPNLQSNDVYVIDPATLKVVDKFRVGSILSTSSRRGTCARSGSRTTPRTPRSAA